MGLLLGVDCGSTVVKVVAFDRDGSARGSAMAQLGQHAPQPRWVERDVADMWQRTSTAIAQVVAQLGGRDRIDAIGVTGHGDGLYLVDAQGRPTRPGIGSLDSRAHRIVARWASDGTAAEARTLTGQEPMVASPAALLRWVAEQEPATLAASRWALACKDVLKIRLTGRASADPTEASTSFCDVRTQAYSPAALDLFGLQQHARLLAPVVDSTEVMGTVTTDAAASTGLVAGTPVVSGLHDVDACAIGSGGFGPGQLSIVAGTYAINQVVGEKPAIDERWLTRNFIRTGAWMHMAVSPASATNLEWFVQALLPELAADGGQRASLFDRLLAEAAAVATEPLPMYLPFLYGSPRGPQPSGTFLGLRGWHRRGHLVAAILEGVVLNHRWHVDDLRSRFTLHEARLTGGGARSDRWAQMFADALQLPVARVREPESGALGAALCAGLGVGAFASLPEAVEAAVAVTDTRQPEVAATAHWERRAEAFHESIERLEPVWADRKPG